MKTKIIPGGMYADCRPDEHWVCSVGDTVISSWGDLGAPRAMMFNRLGPDRFLVASKSASPGTVWVYDGQWKDTGIDSYGVQGHGWTPVGNLDIMPNSTSQEPMGLRYYDPSAPLGSNLDVTGTTAGWVTGSPSYTSSTDLARARGVSRLFEWTDLGDGILVGQGDAGGTVLQHPVHGHRLLVEGDSRFVQAHRQGSTICVAVTRLSQRDAICVWLEESEIASLPVYGVPDQPPPPPPYPKPEPEPQPMSVSLTAEQEAYLRTRWEDELGPMQDGVRARWKNASDGHAVAAETSDVLFKIAAEMHRTDPSIGLYPKSSGTNHRGRGEDILLIRRDGKVYWKDVVGSISTRNPVLNLGSFEQSNEPDKWVAPFPLADTPPPPPPPPDPVPSELLQKIAAMDKRIAELERRPMHSINGKRIALKSSSGKYVAFEPGGAVLADRDDVGGWEIATVEEQ